MLDVKYEQNTILITIPIPAGYPDTPLVSFIRSQNTLPAFHNFGYIKFDLNANYITSFYVNAQVYNFVASDAEKRAFRGIGKLMLCTLFQLCLNKSHVSNSTTIMLEPVPYIFNDKPSQNIQSLLNYLRTHDGELYNTYLQINKRVTNGEYDRDVFYHNLVDDVMNLKRMGKLVAYYNSLGFTTRPNEPQEMEATVYEILEHCSVKC